MKHLICGTCLALLLMCGWTQAATPSDELKAAQLGTTARVNAFGKLLLTSQPSAEDIALASKQGVKTIINLRSTQENKDFNEQQVAEAQGIRYVNVPFESAAEMTDAVFDSVRSQLKSADQSTLLHCASANRVGAMWLAFRALDGGLSTEAALAEARTVGLRSPELEKKALEYIDKHR